MSCEKGQRKSFKKPFGFVPQKIKMDQFTTKNCDIELDYGQLLKKQVINLESEPHTLESMCATLRQINKFLNKQRKATYGNLKKTRK